MIKKVMYTGLFLLFCISFIQADPPEGPQLEFAAERYDYGIIALDSLAKIPTQIEIEFTNTGKAPLILSQVRGCCGTRIMHWPRNPVLPGEKGVINIQIRLAPKAHRISRTVTVTSNSTSGPTSVFRIVGEVIKAEETSTL